MSYDANFLVGRGNRTSLWRYSTPDLSAHTTNSMTYNTNGSVSSATDGASHTTSISYTDSFSDSTNHNTLAYPTSVTINDPGAISSSVQYNYDFGAMKQSNPTEMTPSWQAYGDDSVGWYYTQQSYDWKGRPLVTTNTDGTTKSASYTGCGCAGGEMVTLTDEGTIDGGVAKKRQQKIYHDVQGRAIKTESLNWENGSVYSTTVNTYNARDQ